MADAKPDTRAAVEEIKRAARQVQAEIVEARREREPEKRQAAARIVAKLQK